jgi:hypothetical protein
MSLCIQIVATMNTRLAAWCLSGVQQDAWRIHSTLTLPQDHTITAVDCKSGNPATSTSEAVSHLEQVFWRLEVT